VGETGDAASGRAMGQWQRSLDWLEASLKEIQGHPDFGPETGSDAGQ
jgi:hypothetical protein